MEIELPLSALEESSIEDLFLKLDLREQRMIARRFGVNVSAFDPTKAAQMLARNMDFTLRTKLNIEIS